MLKPLSAGERKHFLSGWAARHQLQVYKIISHFQAQLLSHSGCLFFAKTNRVEVDNKPSISQSENEFLNAENQFGDLKRSVLKNLCHKAEHAFLEPFFFFMQIPLQSIYVSLKHKHWGDCKSTCQCLELHFRESIFHSLFLDCCWIAVQWGLLNISWSELTLLTWLTVLLTEPN